MQWFSILFDDKLTSFDPSNEFDDPSWPLTLSYLLRLLLGWPQILLSNLLLVLFFLQHNKIYVLMNRDLHG